MSSATLHLNLRQYNFHVYVSLNLTLYSSAEGVRSLFQEDNFEFVNYGHVQGINLNLKVTHGFLHFLKTRTSLFVSLGLDY